MEEDLRKTEGERFLEPKISDENAMTERKTAFEENLSASEERLSEKAISADRSYFPQLTEAKARQLAPLTLAFIGDAAYELSNRTRLVQEADRNPKELQKRASAFARAPFQSAAMEILEPVLTEKELEIYHRGRNAKSQTKAKNATVQEYRRATGFEAVLGYLYLTGNTERMLELIRIANEGA